MRRIALLSPLALLAVGCPTNEVGGYRVDEVRLESTVCTGVDAARRTAWAEALASGPITDMAVGTARGVAGAASEAQYSRDDGGVFFAEILPTAEERTFRGERLVSNATVSTALLGADYSALLEAEDIDCEFDLRVTVDLNFRDEQWREAISTLEVAVEQPFSSNHACVLLSCVATWTVAAYHADGTNPGATLDEE